MIFFWGLSYNGYGGARKPSDAFWAVQNGELDPEIPNLPLEDFAVGGTTGQIKYWSGAAFVAKPVKWYNGSTWVTKPLKYYNGSTWVTTTY